MRVELVPYDESWPREFERIRAKLAGALGELAVRIDHIGSTSIRGMRAKDCVDMQVSVRSFDDREEIVRRFKVVGFEELPYGFDHEPPGWEGRSDDWSKMVFAPPPDERLCNVHVRSIGRPNQRYALLFRDYLRADEDAVRTWIAMKERLAEQFPDDSMTYGYVKDPATDVLLIAAEMWARETGWTP